MILVDRIEDQIAVLEICEDERPITHKTISLQELGIAVCEGDVLIQTEHGWQVDLEQTQSRRQLAVRRFCRLMRHEN